jgi:hypothetical protein
MPVGPNTVAAPVVVRPLRKSRLEAIFTSPNEQQWRLSGQSIHISRQTNAPYGSNGQVIGLVPWLSPLALSPCLLNANKCKAEDEGASGDHTTEILKRHRDTAEVQQKAPATAGAQVAGEKPGQ